MCELPTTTAPRTLARPAIVKGPGKTNLHGHAPQRRIAPTRRAARDLAEDIKEAGVGPGLAAMAGSGGGSAEAARVRTGRRRRRLGRGAPAAAAARPPPTDPAPRLPGRPGASTPSLRCPRNPPRRLRGQATQTRVRRSRARRRARRARGPRRGASPARCRRRRAGLCGRRRSASPTGRRDGPRGAARQPLQCCSHQRGHPSPDTAC